LGESVRKGGGKCFKPTDKRGKGGQKLNRGSYLQGTRVVRTDLLDDGRTKGGSPHRFDNGYRGENVQRGERFDAITRHTRPDTKGGGKNQIRDVSGRERQRNCGSRKGETDNEMVVKDLRRTSTVKVETHRHWR